jgi:hypothetical protein
VIFESLRNATWDLFKQKVDQRTPATVVATPLDEVLPQMGPDGHWVLYAGCLTGVKPAPCKLMRTPVDGGTPEEVPIGGPLDEFRCALGAGKRCVLRITAQNEYYAFYDLDPIRGKGRELARTKLDAGSPGGLGRFFRRHTSRYSDSRFARSADSDSLFGARNGRFTRARLSVGWSNRSARSYVGRRRSRLVRIGGYDCREPIVVCLAGRPIPLPGGYPGLGRAVS